MKTSKEVLSSLLTTALLGQSGLRCLLNNAMDPNLRLQLRGQLLELDTIETEARAIAGHRGWELKEPAPAALLLKGKLTGLRLTGGSTDSRVAEIGIRVHTAGMLCFLRVLHQFGGQDDRIRVLSQRLLDCAKAGIWRLNEFL